MIFPGHHAERLPRCDGHAQSAAVEGMASLHEGFGKEQLVESYWGAGQPKAGININEELFKIWKRDCIPFYVSMISVAI